MERESPPINPQYEKYRVALERYLAQASPEAKAEAKRLIEEERRLERVEILQKLQDGLLVLKNISENQRTDHQKWVVGAVEGALGKIGDDGKYEIKAGENSQREGVPVDGLIKELEDFWHQAGARARELENEVRRLRQKHSDVLANWVREGATDITSEHQIKMAWQEVASGSSVEIKNQVDATRKTWATAGGIGDDYDPATGEYKLQSGEAMRQLVENKLVGEVRQAKNKTDALGGTRDFLIGKSKGYFEAHPEMKGDKQHWRTEYEAKFISRDFRSTGAVQTDYDKAMVEMSARRELVLPNLKVELPEVVPVVVEPTPASVEPISLQPEKPEAKRAYLINVSEVVKQYAHRQAELRLNELQKAEVKGFFKTIGSGFKKMWLNLGEEGYRRKFEKEILTEITSNKNLLAEIEARLGKSKSATTLESKGLNEKVLSDVIDRYQKEVAEAEEKGEVVVDARVNQEATKLFVEYAQGAITTREEFDKQVEEKILPLLAGRKFTLDSNYAKEAEKNKKDKIEMYANNYFELAKNYKTYIDKKLAEYPPDQRGKLIEHLKGELGLDLQLGFMRRDLEETKPQEVLKWYDKLVDFTQSIPIINKIVANPLAYGILGGVAGTFVGRGVKRFAVGKGLIGIAGMAPWLAPIILGMGFGGAYLSARRSRNLQYDRGMDLRRRALGAESGGERTDKMREFNYGIKRADEIVSALQAVRAKSGLTDADKEILGEVIARFKVEKERSVDLIGANIEEGSKHKTRIKSVTDVKYSLKQSLEKFGLKESDIQSFVDKHYKIFIDDIDNKDKLFNKFRHWEMGKAGVIGATMGLAGGAAGQYLWEQGQELFGFTPKTESAITHLMHYMKGEGSTAYAGAMQEIPIAALGEAAHHPTIKIPQGWSLSSAGESNHYDLINADGNKVSDIILNSDGTLDQGSLDELSASGFKVSDQVETVRTSVPDATVPAGKVNPLEAFKDQLGTHPRTDWHDELGTRYSKFFNKLIEFEGKQQMLYLEKGADGTVYINADKIAQNLVKNVNEAFAKFGTNPDGSHDSKLLHLKEQLTMWARSGELHKHLQAAIIPTESANRQGLSMLVDGASGNHKIALPPGISRLFTTPESLKYLHHPLRYIELRLNGHTLATSVGGDMQAVAPTPIEKIIETPVHHTEIIPTAHDFDAPPVLPFYPRKALERTPENPIILPYYLYGETMTPEKEEQIRKQLSETLRSNPDANLDHYKEIEEYIGKWNSDYRQEIEKFVREVGPMNEKCRVSVCIPVAGHQEGNSIYKTLENYLNQTIEKGNFEIVLFVNHPENDVNGNKIRPDNTLEEIERFKKDYPGLNVVTMYKSLPLEEVKIGYIRKLLNDTVLMRHHQRGKSVEDLIIISNNADNKGVAPEYIKNFVNKFDENSNIDSYLGQVDWDPEVYIKNPLAHVGTRLFQYINIQNRSKGRHIESSGCNFALRSSVYAAVGGYDGEATLGEDNELGAAIKYGRKNARVHKGVEYAGARVSRIYSSARRIEYSLKNGLSPIEQWDNGFSAFDDEVRKVKWNLKGKAIDYEDVDQVKSLINELENIINRTINRMSSWGLVSDSLVFKKSLGWLGIKYEMVGDKRIKIINADRLIRDLKVYQSDGLLIRDLKLGKSDAKEKLSKLKSERNIVESSALENRLVDFYKNDQLILHTNSVIPNLDKIKISANKKKVGDILVADDLSIYNGDDSKVLAGYKEGEDKVVILKEVGSNTMINRLEEQGWSGYGLEVSSFDSYLKKKGFSNKNVLLADDEFYEVSKSGSPKLARIYEPALSDLQGFLNRGGKLSIKESLSVMIRSCDGINGLHKNNIANIDLAPLNILVFKDGIKITDLDGSSISSDGNKFIRKSLGLNRFICAPELFGKNNTFDKTVDVYAAGANLYYLLTGKWPYDIDAETTGMSREEVMDKYKPLHMSGNIDIPSNIPVELGRVIKKAMSPNPTDRYQTIEELNNELLNIYESI